MARNDGSDLLKQLDEVINLSKELQGEVESEQWESLAEKELKRKEMLEACFQEPVPEQYAAEVADKIKIILSIDEHIMKTCRSFQENISESIGKMRKGKVALDAYNQTSR